MDKYHLNLYIFEILATLCPHTRPTVRIFQYKPLLGTELTVSIIQY